MSVRVQRLRARRARRRVLRGLQVVGAVTVAALSVVVATVVVTLHLGIRPVLTGSMRPDYGPGAILVTRQVPTASLRPGIIVLLVPPGEHAAYAHRIVSISGTRWAPVVTTKGDANRSTDPWHAKITATHVNEVIGSFPGIGRIAVALRGTGQILLALVGGTLAAWAGARWFLGTPSRPPDGRSSTRRRLSAP